MKTDSHDPKERRSGSMKVPKDKINLRSGKALEIDTSLMNKLIKTKIASDAAFD